MKKIRFITLFLRHFFKRLSRKQLRLLSFKSLSARQKKGLILIPVLFLSLALLIKFASDNNSNGSFSEGIVGFYTQENLPASVAGLISEPLVILDQSGHPQSNLVSGWQVNNNATVYTFKLKNDLMWNDGTRVKSRDIQFNLADVEVSYPDEATIEFKLVDSFSPFPTLLTAPVFKDGGLVGLGKYKVVKEEKVKGITSKLILHPSRKDDSSANRLPVVTIRFYGDEKTARTAFELGEIDSLLGVSNTSEWVNHPSVSLKNIPNFNKLVAIFYNTQDPILSDKNLRKILGLAVPLIEGEERAKSPIFAGSWAYNDQLKETIGDKETAKSLLSKVENGKESTITLTATPSLSDLGEQIVQAWEEIGFKAVLRVESGIPQNFQALLQPQSVPTDPDQYALWHSTQTKTNLSKLVSARIDKDLEDGRKISDPEERKEKYLDFQRVLLDESPATFLYFPKTTVVFRKRVENDLNKVLDLQIN